jgi:hypothetical protein
MFVVKRLHLFPFTKQTLYSMGLTLIYFFIVLFLAISFIPIVAIGLKSILVTLAYTYINYKFVISIEINEVIDTVFKKLNIKL